MRAAKAGWHHVLCADVYVYHVGGVSFGERQAQLQAQAREALAASHPDYDERIQTFIREDPVRPLRVAVDWERALLAPEQALYVLRERDEALARAQRIASELEQSFRTSKMLLIQSRDELQLRDQALTEAERYVREREADVALLTAQMRSMRDELSAELEMLRARNLDLTAQLNEIHASRVWRYTEFLRKL